MPEQRGVDGVMVKRNKALQMLAELKETDMPTEEVCKLVSQVICGDEGLTVHQVFPKEQADKIVQACQLVCELPAE